MGRTESRRNKEVSVKVEERRFEYVTNVYMVREIIFGIHFLILEKLVSNAEAEKLRLVVKLTGCVKTLMKNHFYLKKLEYYKLLQDFGMILICYENIVACLIYRSTNFKHNNLISKFHIHSLELSLI